MNSGHFFSLQHNPYILFIIPFCMYYISFIVYFKPRGFFSQKKY